MNDLVPNNKLVLDWPNDKPMVKCGDSFDAGFFGQVFVSATHTGRICGVPFRYVELSFHFPVTPLEVKPTKPKPQRVMGRVVSKRHEG